MFTDLGLYLVGSLIICVILRASSLDCRMAVVLSISQFRSPNNTSSEDRWGAIHSLGFLGTARGRGWSIASSSILSENVIVWDGNFRVFGGLPKPRFRHG
jgi:hypothetical protein